jgi:hypothetical protein
MAILNSFSTISPHMPQHAWREAMLGKLPGKWARSMSRRLEMLDRQHHDWMHGNVYLREHVASYAEAVLPLTATLSDIRDCAVRRAADAYALVERLGDTASIVSHLTALCQRWRIAAPSVEHCPRDRSGLVGATPARDARSPDRGARNPPWTGERTR